MPSNCTEHYHLNQWEPEDKVLRTDFNADNAKLETALTALSAQVAKMGNCQIWTTRYVGTGTCGAEHPTTLTFPQKPLVAMIESGGGTPTFLLPRNGWLYVAESDYPMNYLSWDGCTASWYTASVNQYPASQLNAPNLTYYVIALFAMDE